MGATTVVETRSVPFRPSRAIAVALPMTGVVEGMRQLLRGGPLPYAALGISFGLNVAVPVATTTGSRGRFVRSGSA